MSDFLNKSFGILLTAILPVSQALATEPFTTLASPSSDVARAAKQDEPLIHVNTTVPKVDGPKPGLNFSARPTVQEFFRARIFEEPLVPIGAPDPSAAENAALADALRGYASRSGPDDFSSLDDFLKKYPASPWRAALLVNLGLEAYRTGHYSRTFDAWGEAWKLARDTTEPAAKAVADRAAGELALMYARVGRTDDLAALLKSVEGRVFNGPASEKMVIAREGLYLMGTDPGRSFRCGPMALSRIVAALHPGQAGGEMIEKSASTKDGFSLPQVADLSQKLDLNYQMAFREKGAAIVTPSVVHWKAGHYAAIIRQETDGRFLVQDPTFLNDVWVTQAALDAEASGYFLAPPGALASGWRAVDEMEGGAIWGKGRVPGPDPNGGPGPPTPPPCPSPPSGGGMVIPSASLLFVSLTLIDTPVGYTPPAGPDMKFTVHYNQRDSAQPANFSYVNLGPKWTFDWVSYIQDDPTNPAANVTVYRRGGFTHAFTNFNAGTQTYALQPYDQNKLVRTSATSYELRENNGAKSIFSLSDGSAGSARKIFLKQYVDPAGDAVSLTYDGSFRLVTMTDALGQVTTLAYGLAADPYKITRVTDPFGRFAAFDYDAAGRLAKITDVLGLTSQFTYDGATDFVNALTTPYGTTTFTKTESGDRRSLETHYPDGSRERVEFNQDTGVTPTSEPAALVPKGMLTHNQYLEYRNTYYWSKAACAYGYGDYTKARIYHWAHTPDFNGATGVIESMKEPLENRVWFDYPGQTDAYVIGTSNQPAHTGRVLDDGTTQLSSVAYNDFGLPTKEVDPVGRTFSYGYADNGQDLLEKRMTRNGANELLFKRTFDSRHLPLVSTDPAGQTTTYTYNTRGQVLTITDPKAETITLAYDPQGRPLSMDGPLPGPGDAVRFTYDGYNRIRTFTDLNAYTLTYDYDALDHLIKITHPDGTYEGYTYQNLDIVAFRDRAARLTTYAYNPVRQMVRRTDALNRATTYVRCLCGDLTAMIDPLGRRTSWTHDVQGRLVSKEYSDGSKITNVYETGTSRVRRKIDERSQVTNISYHLDDRVKQIDYDNPVVATPTVSFTYDPDYARMASMTDGLGTTLYRFHPITMKPIPGAGHLAVEDGPLANDTVTYEYDELSRVVRLGINGVVNSVTYDAAARETSETNPLGTFNYTYDQGTRRRLSIGYPNGVTVAATYADNVGDQRLQSLTSRLGANLVTQFSYGYDTAALQITSWSQKFGTEAAAVYDLGYDQENQLTSARKSQNGSVLKTYGYTMDAAGNRLGEQIDGTTRQAAYNALNQQTSSNPDPAAATTYQWDVERRLTSVQSGNRQSLFAYDGMGRRVGIRELMNGVEVSNRRYVWVGAQISEERDASGVVTKRFLSQGVKVESGAAAGKYYYLRDHLDSVWALLDEQGAVRARYDYDPYGRATKISGDRDTDFGYAGYFYHAPSSLGLTKFRAYDPNLGKWLSRDPLRVEELLGTSLYAYAVNNPISFNDPLGLQHPPTGPANPPPACKSVDFSQVGYELMGIGGCLAELANALQQGNFRPFAGGGGGNYCSGALSQSTAFSNCDPPPDPNDGPNNACDSASPPAPCLPAPSCEPSDPPQPPPDVCIEPPPHCGGD